MNWITKNLLKRNIFPYTNFNINIMVVNDFNLKGVPNT